MVVLLPPDTSTTFIAALIIPLILGFLVGLIAKSILRIGVAIILLILILMWAGIIAPDQVVGPIVSFFRSGSSYATKVKQVAGYLPYASVTFLIGAVLGFLKG
jgi:uncharacterized membrane protein (Fun14 family)